MRFYTLWNDVSKCSFNNLNILCLNFFYSSRLGHLHLSSVVYSTSSLTICLYFFLSQKYIRKIVLRSPTPPAVSFFDGQPFKVEFSRRSFHNRTKICFNLVELFRHINPKTVFPLKHLALR